MFARRSIATTFAVLVASCVTPERPQFTAAGLTPRIQLAAGHYPLVAINLAAPDSAELVFVDSTLTATGLHAGTWMFGPPVTEAEADSCPPEKVLGRRLARILWREGGKAAGLRMVAVQVRGVDHERYTSIRMFYYPVQLEGPWAGDPEHS